MAACATDSSLAERHKARLRAIWVHAGEAEALNTAPSYVGLGKHARVMRHDSKMYLDGGHVVSDDDKLSLLGLDQRGDVVQAELDDNGLGAELSLGQLTLGGSLNG